MSSRRQILRDYATTGEMNSLLPVVAFVDDVTLLTKGGAVGHVFRLGGVDYEGADHAAREIAVHRFEAATRPFDERYRFYQFVCKRRTEAFVAEPCAHPVAAAAIQRRTDDFNNRRDELYTLELYLVILLEGAGTKLRVPFSKHKALTVLAADLERQVQALHHATNAWMVSLADVVKPVRLAKQEAYGFLRRLVNPAPHKQHAPLLYDAHVDYFMADSPLHIEPDHLLLDGYTVKVLTMKEPPAHTYAHVLQQLHTVPGEWIACLEWQPRPVASMRRDLWLRGMHYAADLTAKGRAAKAQVEAAQLDMEVDQRTFGECSLTLVLVDHDPKVVRQATADAIKVLAAHDGAFVEETYNLANAWLATIPGNDLYNLRRLALLDLNYADLSFIFTLDQGQTWSEHLNAPALMAFDTPSGSVYRHTIHTGDDGDVGHAAIFGSTGSGKSVMVNAMLMHAQQYDPFTVIFDLGHSYRRLAKALGGSYLELGPGKQYGLKLNPFALPKTPENLEFLTAFVRLLLETDGDEKTKLHERESRDVYEQVESIYELEPAQRRLYSLTLSAGLQERLNQWLVGGRFPLFDAEYGEDTLSLQRFQVFEFSAMQKFPQLLEPLLFYVLHRISAHLGKGFTICVLDEAWRFIKHPVLKEYVTGALKTWRKENAAVWLATQGLGDFKDEGLLQTVIESCPTQMLLRNPKFDRALTKERLGLNEMELDLIAHLRPRQVFLKRPDVAKVLNLHFDPESLHLYKRDDGAIRLVDAVA